MKQLLSSSSRCFLYLLLLQLLLPKSAQGQRTTNFPLRVTATDDSARTMLNWFNMEMFQVPSDISDESLERIMNVTTNLLNVEFVEIFYNFKAFHFDLVKTAALERENTKRQRGLRHGQFIGAGQSRDDRDLQSDLETGLALSIGGSSSFFIQPVQSRHKIEKELLDTINSKNINQRLIAAYHATGDKALTGINFLQAVIFPSAPPSVAPTHEPTSTPSVFSSESPTIESSEHPTLESSEHPTVLDITDKSGSSVGNNDGSDNGDSDTTSTSTSTSTSTTDGNTDAGNNNTLTAGGDGSDGSDGGDGGDGSDESSGNTGDNSDPTTSGSGGNDSAPTSGTDDISNQTSDGSSNNETPEASGVDGSDGTDGTDNSAGTPTASPTILQDDTASNSTAVNAISNNPDPVQESGTVIYTSIILGAAFVFVFGLFVKKRKKDKLFLEEHYDENNTSHDKSPLEEINVIVHKEHGGNMNSSHSHLFPVAIEDTGGDWERGFEVTPRNKAANKAAAAAGDEKTYESDLDLNGGAVGQHIHIDQTSDTPLRNNRNMNLMLQQDMMQQQIINPNPTHSPTPEENYENAIQTVKNLSKILNIHTQAFESGYFTPRDQLSPATAPSFDDRNVFGVDLQSEADARRNLNLNLNRDVESSTLDDSTLSSQDQLDGAFPRFNHYSRDSQRQHFNEAPYSPALGASTLESSIATSPTYTTASEGISMTSSMTDVDHPADNNSKFPHGSIWNEIDYPQLLPHSNSNKNSNDDTGTYDKSPGPSPSPRQLQMTIPQTLLNQDTMTQTDVSQATDATSKDSKQLIHDLVWLEKRIAQVRNATSHTASDNHNHDSNHDNNNNNHDNNNNGLSIDTSNDANAQPQLRANGDIPKALMSPIMQNITCHDCFAPPGRLNIIIQSTKDGPCVHSVYDNSSLVGQLHPGDLIIAVDNIDTRAMTADQVMKIMQTRNGLERKITVLHFDE